MKNGHSCANHKGNDMRTTATIAALACALLALVGCKQENNYPATDVTMAAVSVQGDRIVSQKWVTVGKTEDQTEYLVDVWSIVDREGIKTYHYNEDRSKSAKSDASGFKITGVSTYHAMNCKNMVFADIDTKDGDLSKAQWKPVAGDAIASREAEVVCFADLRDRPPGVSSE